MKFQLILKKLYIINALRVYAPTLEYLVCIFQASLLNFAILSCNLLFQKEAFSSPNDTQ